MLRRHFMTGTELPDFIITYHAPQHIPFSGSYKGVLRGHSSADDFGDENNTVFKCVSDKWKDGVGEYGIKILNWVDGTWYNRWDSKRFVDLYNHNVGSLGVYVDVVDGVYKNMMVRSNTITDVIFPNEIKHLNGSALSSYLDNYNNSVVNVRLPENLETLSNGVLRSLRALKTITIPSSVSYMGDYTLQIDCDDNIMSTVPGNYSLEEIIMKPMIPPRTDVYAHPIGIYDPNSLYTNHNLKIRVYADCLDTYKNNSVWGQYSDLYDTINNAIVYYIDNERHLYTEQTDITIVPQIQQWKQATTILLPNTIETINAYVFSNCNNLTTLEIPKNVIKFTGEFYNTPLNTIRWNAINCEGYEYSSMFAGIATQIHLFVIGELVEHIPLSLCRNMSNINSIEIPDSVVSVGQSAFDGCSSLKSISIGKSISTMGDMAFYSINKTEPISVFISDLTAWCNITFEGSLSNPLASAYNHNKGLDGNLYLNNELLTHLEIPTSINSIKRFAFRGCSSIKSITIPESVTSIEPYALANCKNLRTITYNGSIAQWNNVIKKDDWNYGTPATYVQCTDGQVSLK